MEIKNSGLGIGNQWAIPLQVSILILGTVVQLEDVGGNFEN